MHRLLHLTRAALLIALLLTPLRAFAFYVPAIYIQPVGSGGYDPVGDQVLSFLQADLADSQVVTITWHRSDADYILYVDHMSSNDTMPRLGTTLASVLVDHHTGAYIGMTMSVCGGGVMWGCAKDIFARIENYVGER